MYPKKLFYLPRMALNIHLEKCFSPLHLLHFGMLFIMFLLGVCIVSCQSPQHVGEGEGGDTLRLRYAKLFTLIDHDRYSEVLLRNPWQPSAPPSRFLLVEKGVLHHTGMPSDMPQGVMVEVPVERSVVFHSPYVYLLSQLRAEQSVVGVCDARYMLSPFVLRGLTARTIMDCGNGMAPDVERMLALHPDALLLSAGGQIVGLEKLRERGVPVLACADYMEQTALGQAEWMRLIGRLYGRASQADSLFAVVDSTYQALKQRARTWTSGKTLLTERLTGNVWYCPGGQSTVAQLLRDARGGYPFFFDTHSGALPLSVETVLAKGSNADVWAVKYQPEESPLTCSKLLDEYAGYARLKAFREGNVYGCNSLAVPFFDEVPFRPDFYLRELLILLHREGAELGRLRYFHRLQP